MNESSILEWAHGLVIKTALPTQEGAPGLDWSFLLIIALGRHSDNSCDWVPATHLGDLD